MAIETNWFDLLKYKKKKLRRRKQKKNLKRTQRDLKVWGDEDWGSPEQHRAKAKGKKPKSKTKGRYMPRKTYESTDKKTLRYQNQKKREGRKKGIQHVPTGKKFSQK